MPSISSMMIVPKMLVHLEQLPRAVNSKMLAIHLTLMLHRHNNNKPQNQRSQKVLYQTHTLEVTLELPHHNKIKVVVIHLELSNRIASKQQIRIKTKCMEIKDIIISSKWAITNNSNNNNQITTNNNNSVPNNKVMEAINNNQISKINFRHSNNQIKIITSALIINRITEASSNSLGSITTLIISRNNNNNSKDLIIRTNSNSPLSNKTPIKVHRLICFECSIDLFNLKGK